jgi:hypothetical protein
MSLMSTFLAGMGPKPRGSTLERPSDRSSGTSYVPEDAIAQQYRFADRISNQDWAPNWAGVLAAGLGGLGGGMHRTSAQDALTNNQSLMSRALRSAGGAKTLEEATGSLMSSGVPDLERAGVETKLKALEPTKQTDDMREYEYAKSQGFTGSFMDYRNSGKAAQAPTISEIFDDQGRAQKVQWNSAAGKFEPIGGAKATTIDGALQRAIAQADVKRVSEYKDSADAAEELRGNLADLKAARAAAKEKGRLIGPQYKHLPNWEAETQRVASAAENVRLGFVAKTKGAVSDAEMRIFGAATPNEDMSDEAATPIIDGMDLAAQRVQERSIFFDTWLRAKGSLDGAPEAWKSYTEKNPIIQKQQDGSFTLVPENVGNWRQAIPGLQTPSSGTARAPAHVPQEAVQELLADPSPAARAEFDEIFGDGASQSILEGQ